MPETISEAIPAACDEAIRQLWDHLDDQLCTDESDAVRLHLVECAHCHGFERFQATFRDAMRAARPAAARAPWHVRARILDALANAGYCP